MVTDFLGNAIAPGDYFAYPLTQGRSAAMALFQYVEPYGGDWHKARPVTRSSDWRKDNKYKVFVYDEEARKGSYRDMTPEERAKVDGKTSKLGHISTRAVLLKDFKE